jgi:NTE family protein
MTFGLALGGGGARGLAHVPMLEAIDELGLRPAEIVGCSMGALVGAMYAGGMSGLDIREHALQLLSNKIEFAKFVFGSKKTKFMDLVSLGGFQALHLNSEKLVELAMPNHLPVTFEECKIPFKAVSTNFETMTEAVHHSGALQKAVAASISIPGVIIGPKIEGQRHVDGGVVNPVPFDHLNSNALVVAIDVTGKPRPLGSKAPSNLELAVGSLLIMFNKLAESRRAIRSPEIYISPAVDQFSPADFFAVKEIFASAQPAKDALKRQLEAKLG